MAGDGCTPYSPWVVRTHFSESDKRWQILQDELVAPQGEDQFRAYVRFQNDESAFSGLRPIEVVNALPDNYPQLYVFVADEDTLTTKESTVLVISFEPGDAAEAGEGQDAKPKPKDVKAEDLRSFRAVPSAVQCVENNLSIANMDFDDFLESSGSDGVFRGFPD
ncbi:unnamed protein product [Symbiodinium natans]|uniref:DUF6924 domain-containing protein n=1 Tax=Symbiodinium natans TaxID=878477 RepID=A0A812M9C4_9DINO|nr:unnamed protein product [Symbiodinium natans]